MIYMCNTCKVEAHTGSPSYTFANIFIKIAHEICDHETAPLHFSVRSIFVDSFSACTRVYNCLDPLNSKYCIDVTLVLSCDAKSVSNRHMTSVI